MFYDPRHSVFILHGLFDSVLYCGLVLSEIAEGTSPINEGHITGKRIKMNKQTYFLLPSSCKYMLFTCTWISNSICEKNSY